MRHSVPLIAICLLAVTLFSGLGYAQTCMLTGPNTNPSVTALTSGAWAFRLFGFSERNTATEFISAVGSFVPFIATGFNGQPRGALTSSISTNVGGTMHTTLMPYAGEWQLDPGPNSNCTTGVMQLASPTAPAGVAAVRFVLEEGGTRMYLTSTGNDGMILTGNAAFIGPVGPAPTGQACDLNGPSAQALTRGSWAFTMDGFSFDFPRSFLQFVSANGVFTASVGPTSRSSNPQGRIASTVSINIGGTMYTILLPVVGAFHLDPGPNADCSTGTMLLASGTNPPSLRSVRFILYDGGSKMYLMSTDNDGVVLKGNASQQ